MASTSTGRSTRSKSTPSLSVLRVRQHYARLGLRDGKGWTRNMFYGLCQRLNMTPEELAAVCGVLKKGDLVRWINGDRFPTYVSLHFMLLDHAIQYRATGHFGDNPVTEAMKEVYREN